MNTRIEDKDLQTIFRDMMNEYSKMHHNNELLDNTDYESKDISDEGKSTWYNLSLNQR